MSITTMYVCHTHYLCLVYQVLLTLPSQFLQVWEGMKPLVDGMSQSAMTTATSSLTVHTWAHRG